MFRPKAIIFDIDGTLCPEISWTALTAGLGASVAKHLTIYERYKCGVIDYPTSRQQLLALWHATGHANRQEFTRLLAHWRLYPGIKAAVKILARHYRLGLISGSFDIWVETVARRLRIRDWYANTTLSWDAQGELITYDYVLDQAGKKQEQLLDFCARYNLHPADCMVVGDSDNDQALFELTGRGIAIGNVPAELRHAASHELKSVTQLPRLLEPREV